MGSSNGATRGQLRPYLSGRTPPFVLVGLLVVLGILGFSYWSLNTQYNDVQTEIQKLQDRLRLYAEKRESVEKVNNVLQVQLQTCKDESGKYKISLEKKDQELNNIVEQLHSREEEVNKANAEMDSLKTSYEKLENTDKQKDLEISSLQDQTKTLKVENQELSDAKAQLTYEIESLKNLKKNKDGQGLTNDSSKNGIEPETGKLEEKNKDGLLSDPNVGMPPQNIESRNPQPLLPIINKPITLDSSKVQTPVPESPDIDNPEKFQDETPKVILNDIASGANEAEIPPPKPDNI